MKFLAEGYVRGMTWGRVSRSEALQGVPPPLLLFSVLCPLNSLSVRFILLWNLLSPLTVNHSRYKRKLCTRTTFLRSLTPQSTLIGHSGKPKTERRYRWLWGRLLHRQFERLLRGRGNTDFSVGHCCVASARKKVMMKLCITRV